jgi:hypothetical protein
MSAALLMLAMFAWVVVSALLASVMALIGAIDEKAGELQDWSYEPDDFPDWPV